MKLNRYKINLLLVLSYFIVSCASQNSNSAEEDCGHYDSRSRECIKQVFQKNQSKITTLYYTELKHEPSLIGRVVFNIHIDSTGKVNQVFVTENESNSVHLANQLADVIKQFQFYDGVEYSFSYPIELAP